MKETDTMQSYKYLQAIFGDKWVDWGVSVGFLLLIASWFVPRNTADFLVDFIVTGLMLVVAIRIGCVIVRVRRGDELSRPNSLIGSIPIAIQRLPAGMNQFTVTHHLQIAFTGIETIRRIESDIGNKT